MKTAIDFYANIVNLYLTTEQIESLKEIYELAKLKEKNQIKFAFITGSVFDQKNPGGSDAYYEKNYVQKNVLENELIVPNENEN